MRGKHVDGTREPANDSLSNLHSRLSGSSEENFEFQKEEEALPPPPGFN